MARVYKKLLNWMRCRKQPDSKAEIQRIYDNVKKVEEDVLNLVSEKMSECSSTSFNKMDRVRRWQIVYDITHHSHS